MESTEMTSEMEALKGRLRATWIAGDFGVIARSIEHGAEESEDHGLHIRQYKTLDKMLQVSVHQP